MTSVASWKCKMSFFLVHYRSYKKDENALIGCGISFHSSKILGILNAKYYGISGIEEAVAYLQHPILGQRLRVVSETILGLPSNNARSIFGDIDSLKLRSSMTLFDIASPNDIFAQVIDKYFNKQSDNRTISIIKTYGTI